MRDYLSILVPLVGGLPVDHDGERHSAHGGFSIDEGRGLPVLVAALGPQMLRLAGRMAAGTVTTMAGPRTLIGDICLTIREAVAGADRPEPRVVATLSVCVTDDVVAARARAGGGVEGMAALPSYAALVRRVEGGSALLAGSEHDLDGMVADLEAAGVTIFCRSPSPGVEPTTRPVRTHGCALLARR